MDESAVEAHGFSSFDSGSSRKDRGDARPAIHTSCSKAPLSELGPKAKAAETILEVGVFTTTKAGWSRINIAAQRSLTLGRCYVVLQG